MNITLNAIEIKRSELGQMTVRTRVFSKQSNFFWFEPKQTETQSVWLFFGLFRETKKHFFRFVSVFRAGIEPTETNKTLSKQTEKISKKHFLSGGPQNS